MPTRSSKNGIRYVLCFNEEAKGLFQESVKTLMESRCSDFMVYKVVDNKTGNPYSHDEWVEAMEINEATYTKLHLNLCHKIGNVVRKKAKG